MGGHGPKQVFTERSLGDWNEWSKLYYPPSVHFQKNAETHKQGPYLRWNPGSHPRPLDTKKRCAEVTWPTHVLPKELGWRPWLHRRAELEPKLLQKIVDAMTEVAATTKEKKNDIPSQLEHAMLSQSYAHDGYYSFWPLGEVLFQSGEIKYALFLSMERLIPHNKHIILYNKVG